MDRDIKGRFVKGYKQIPWNKGLTKETDERVKKLSEDKKRINKISKANSGKKNHFWIDGRTSRKNYKYSERTLHRKARKKKLGNLKDYNIVVHHINGVKNDNRLENLRSMTRSEHTKLHFELNNIGGIK